MNRYTVIAALGFIALGVCALIASFRNFEESPSAKLRDYCAAVSAALELDARELAGPHEQQVRAAWRFGELVTFHSEPEIRLCAEVMPDLRRRTSCQLADDYSCLAHLARAAAESTRP